MESTHNFVSQTHLPWELKEAVYEAAGYTRYGAQEAFHRSLAPIRVFAAGNQSGKTYANAFEVVPQLLYPIYDPSIGKSRGRRGWIVVPRYALGEPILAEIHRILVDCLGMTRNKTRGGLKQDEYYFDIKKNKLITGGGAQLWIKSADEPAGLHGQPLDYIVIDEAALIPFDIVQINLTPRLAKMGGWMACTGTFEDTITGEWFVEYWRIGRSENEYGIQSFQHKTADNPFVDKKWLEYQKRRYSPALYAARYEAIPKPNERLVIPNFSFATHVNKEYTEFDENLPVYLGIDPGGVYAVGAYQIKYIEELGHEIVAMIDEVYDETGGPTEKVFEICRDRPWWKNVGSDFDGRSGAIDIAAAEARKIWLTRGLNWLGTKRVRIEVGNDVLRNYISMNKFFVHPRCRNFLFEVTKYSYPQVRADKVSRARAPVDQYNHLIKATIYFIVNIIGYLEETEGRHKFIPAPIQRGIF